MSYLPPTIEGCQRPVCLILLRSALLPIVRLPKVVQPPNVNGGQLLEGLLLCLLINLEFIPLKRDKLFMLTFVINIYSGCFIWLFLDY